MSYKTITLRQLSDLNWAKSMAEDWRGNQSPASYAEFDSWIKDVDKAIKQAAQDRLKLRSLL